MHECIQCLKIFIIILQLHEIIPSTILGNTIVGQLSSSKSHNYYCNLTDFKTRLEGNKTNQSQMEIKWIKEGSSKKDKKVLFY